MKRMILAVLAVSVLFAGPMAWAEDSSMEAELQKFIASLDKLEKECPYPLSAELWLSNQLKTLTKGFEAVLKDPSVPKKNAAIALAAKKRVEEILNGPCFRNTRVLDNVQKMIFDIRKEFGFPSGNWQDGLKDDDWRK